MSEGRILPFSASATLALAFVLELTAALAARAAAPVLRLDRGGTGRAELSVMAAPAEVVVVESTADWTTWGERLRGHGPFDGVPAPLLEGVSQGFFRAWSRPRTSSDDWKNLVAGGPDEPFQSEAPPPWNPGPRWIKFALLLEDPHRVVFQDSTRYVFHYDFARVRLPGFQGLTRAEFDAATLRAGSQRAVLGAVLFPPTTNIAEIGIQFVGLDPYPRERIAAWFETVRSAIRRPAGTAVYYLPAFEQAEVAREHREWLAGQGVPVSGAGRWVTGDECYAAGWALGRLVRVPGGEIDAAYREGRLRPGDVLLTDAVPAEVPPVAGIVALEPATPSSHVAILSQSFGIPFVHPVDAGLVASLPEWAAAGREVMVRAVTQWGGCELTVAAVEGPLPAETREAILELKVPPALDLPGMGVAGTIAVSAETLHPRQLDLVGGKAANFGTLRRRVPTNSPSPALAFTFDLWKAYLAQPFDGGGGPTLEAAIARRLAGFAWPPDMAALQTALAEVRKWIADDADFSPAQRAAILEVLRQAGFDPGRNIRFRSSTNMEDSEQFSGAGLYDSYSGCLADDLDGDTAGPSACDPGESRERGVFRALRKVYASFYNDNAYLERLRHRVDESRVGMGVLVHPSTPDAFELANGVATLRVYRDPSSRAASGSLVTQAGAVSVTNPDSAAVPETVAMSVFGSSFDVSVERRSSLVPLGGTVMRWPADYDALARLLNQVALGYEAEFPIRKQLVLDFEYKKVAPGGSLMVKQVREVPSAPERTWVPWLLDTAATYEVFQGEQGDLFARHRLKSRWQFAVMATRLNDAGLAVSPYLRFDGEWRDGAGTRGLAAAPASLPGYAYLRSSDEWVDRWTDGPGAAGWAHELRTTRIRSTTAAEGPLITLGDLGLEWSVTYPTPRPTWAFDPVTGTFGPAKTTRDAVRLVRVSPVTAESHRQERAWTRGKYEVRTAFWWPSEPKGPSAGYTAPLQAWVETRISGLTSRPLVLRSSWAQTYQPGHHNFWESFLFEPRLDPEVPADLVAELEAANIRALWIDAPRDDWSPVVWRAWGLDDTFRTL